MKQSFELIAPEDKRLIWSGAISVEKGQGWVMPWRLPHADLDLFAKEISAASPAGVRLRFATDATAVAFQTEAMPASANLDLYADGSLINTVDFDQGETVIRFENLPSQMKTLELWLHQTTPFQLKGIQVPPGARLERSEDSRPKWITYGSSITHCGTAGSPSFTWPGVVARTKDLNFTSLGFGGQCHADPMIARLIRDLPADFISLKIGINICASCSLNLRSFLAAVLGTVATIREGHPDIPLVVCSPIWNPPFESPPNVVGMTLDIMREEVAKAVEISHRHGDRQIFYVNGLDLFGPDQEQYLPDGVHPDAKGYRILGERFVHEVFERREIRLPSESASVK